MTTHKTWTIMLYLAGDNNLSDEMVWALTELFRLEMPDEIAVTVWFDSLAKGTIQYYGHQNLAAVDGAFRLEGQRFPEQNSANPDVLAGFIKKSAETNKADNYALVLSGHGSGIEGDFLSDNNPKASLKIASLNTVFEDVRKLCEDEQDPAKQQALDAFLGRNGHDRTKMFDVLGMDSCLMSMAEVAAQVKDHVSYLVGSEGFVKATGWPYYRLISHLREDLKSKARLDPVTFAASIVQRSANYYADYHDADISFDMAAVDLGKMTANVKYEANGESRIVKAGLEGALQRFVDFAVAQLKAREPRVSYLILLAHWRAQSYKFEQYTDIGDFFGQLLKVCQTFLGDAPGADQHNGKQPYDVIPKLIEHCEDVIYAAKNAVLCSRVIGPEFQYSRGLSIYFPWSKSHYATGYGKAAFCKTTHWDQFLTEYFAATKREERTYEPTEFKNILPRDWVTYWFPQSKEQEGAKTPGANSAQEGEVKFTPPHGKFTPPHGKMVDSMDLVGDTFSRMKNLATNSEDYLVLPAKEEQKLKRTQSAGAP